MKIAFIIARKEIMSYDSLNRHKKEVWTHILNMTMMQFVITLTWWLRLVGSIKLYVAFAEYSLFYGALLQKRPTILSILITEAASYALCYDAMSHNSYDCNES